MTRDEAIFEACLNGAKYGEIATAQGITGSRVEQIFKSEARRRYPNITAVLTGGFGYRARFLAKLKEVSDREAATAG